MIENIKKWTYEAFDLDPETTTIMVTQLECKEEGCPPLETVIAMLFDGKKDKEMYKVCKGISEVKQEDIQNLKENLGKHDHPH